MRRGAAVGLCLLGSGLLGITAGGAMATDWHQEQRRVAADLDDLTAARAASGSTPELEVAFATATDRALDDDELLWAVAAFAAGAILVGSGCGLLLGRVRERLTRVALHPSLVAAADRKLERLLAEHAQDLVTMLDDHGRFTYVSPSVSSILGHDPAGMIGKRFDAFLEGDPATGTFDVEAMRLDEVGTDTERRLGEPVRHLAHHADGSTRWVETLSHRIDDDRAIGVVTIYSSRDVTERVRLEEALAVERRLLGDTLANIHAGILSVDLDGRVIEANTEFCSMVGFQPEGGSSVVSVEERYEMLDESGELVPVTDRPLARALSGAVVKQFAATLVAADGGRRDVMANSGPLLGSDGLRNGAVLTIHDVSVLRAAESELRSLATVDMLTGLPNRRHLVAALTDALARNTETPEQLALLFLDLDGFKRVNDTYGHEIGDQVLTAVGTRIVGCLRGGDIIARLGGDEFVVIVEHLTALTDVLPLIARIERSIGEPFQVPAGSVTIGASIGVASATAAIDAADLIARADQAMYLHKRERRGEAPTSEPVAENFGVSAPG